MGIRDPYVPSRQGAIDSVNAVVSGHPFDADTLRVIAGQANRQRIEPSTIINVSANLGDDLDFGRPLRIAATEDWKLLMVLRGPRRPIFDQAKARIALIGETGRNIEFAYVTPPDSRKQATGPIAGTGSLIRGTTTLELPRGLSEQSVHVYVRSVGDSTLTNAVTIGGANTLAVDPTLTAPSWGIPENYETTRIITNETYTLGVINDGTYSARAVTPGGTVLWESRITIAQLDTSGSGGRELWLAEKVANSAISATYDIPNVSIEIRNWRGRFTFGGLTVIGEVA